MKLEKILNFYFGLSEPKEISHANDDCGDGDDKRYLNFKYLAKHAADFVWAYLLNTNSCVLFVLFSGRTFSQERRSNRRSKRIRKGKSIELKQTEQR